MAEPAPSVGIVVVNYNSAGFIDEFCTTLAAVDYPNWRLCVVDSASTDDSISSDGYFDLASNTQTAAIAGVPGLT